jgi:hypothetical protein
MSNSKLTPEQKRYLKEFKGYNPNVKFFSFPETGVTVAMVETGRNMGEFSVSIASDTEQKFRRKVGEYHAASRRAEYGQVLPVILFDSMEAVAREIAQGVSGR